MRLFGCDVETISLLLGGKSASEFWLFNLNGDLGVDSCNFNVIKGPEDQVDYLAIESLFLLVFDQLPKVGQLVLVGIDDVIQQFAWILEDVCLVAIFVAFDRLWHGQVVESLALVA